MVEGFKHTEVGLIPEDWGVEEIGKISIKVGSGITPRGGSKIYLDHGRPFIRSQNVGWGRLLLQDVAFIDEDTHQTFASTELKIDDVLLNITGASIGRAAVADDRITGGNVNQHVCIIRTNQKADAKFILALILSQIGQKQIEDFQSGGNRQGLNFGQLRSIQIPIPPNKTEQTAIATALNDADALITALEKLIAKKKAIKQGAMQKLLRPKDGWVERNLGKSATLKARIGWQGLTTAEYKDTGEYFLITGTDFKNGFIDWQNCVYIEKLRYDQDNNIQVKSNDVLVTKDGTIGKVAFINEVPKPATLNSGVFVIRPIGKSFHPKFFYYILLSEHFAKFLGKLSAGSTINHLYQKDFVSFDFWTPKTIDEQKEISEMLFDMDSEIEEFEQKLAKQKQIKRGMMQVLLTGKTRLV